MSRSKPLGFTFFPADFINGVTGQSNATLGAYMRLICHQHKNGSVPIKDEDMLWRICCITPSENKDINWQFLKDKFPDGVNAKLAAVCDFHKKKREKMSNNAKKRWDKNPENLSESSKGDAIAYPIGDAIDNAKRMHTDSVLLDSVLLDNNIDTIRSYCLEHAKYVNPDDFFEKYTANGWVDSKGRNMADKWREVLATWNINRRKAGESLYHPPKKRKMNVASQLKQNERGDDRMIICK